MARESVGRVRITGDPIEDTASVLVLASKLSGKGITDHDITEVLKDNGMAGSAEQLASVRALLP